MSKIELADVYRLARPSSEFVPTNLLQGDPRVMERLRAAGTTLLMKFPPSRRTSLTNIIGIAAGVAAGEAVAHLHFAPDEKGQLLSSNILGMVAYSICALTNNKEFSRSPQNRFARQVASAEPGDLITVRKPGSVREALKFGKSQEPQTVFCVVPQESETDYSVIDPDDFFVNNYLLKLKLP